MNESRITRYCTPRRRPTGRAASPRPTRAPSSRCVDEREGDRPPAEVAALERAGPEKEARRKRDRDRPHEERDDREREPDDGSARSPARRPAVRPRGSAARTATNGMSRHEAERQHERDRIEEDENAPKSAAPARQPRARSHPYEPSVPASQSASVERRSVVNEKPPSHAKSVPHQSRTGGNVELHGETRNGSPCSELLDADRVTPVVEDRDVGARVDEHHGCDPRDDERRDRLEIVTAHAPYRSIHLGREQARSPGTRGRHVDGCRGTSRDSMTERPRCAPRPASGNRRSAV